LTTDRQRRRVDLSKIVAGAAVAQKARERQIKPVATNRKARHRFRVLDTFEAGIALTGNEVKSLREGRISLDESYARVRAGEFHLVGCHIAAYEKTGFDTPDPRRERKLLLNRSEIRRLATRVIERGLTVVPLRVYFRGPWAKVELALARGKGHRDRREDIKRRTQAREVERALSRRDGRRRGR
jgi:SsrA-binding protein